MADSLDIPTALHRLGVSAWRMEIQAAPNGGSCGVWEMLTAGGIPVGKKAKGGTHADVANVLFADMAATLERLLKREPVVTQ